MSSSNLSFSKRHGEADLLIDEEKGEIYDSAKLLRKHTSIFARIKQLFWMDPSSETNNSNGSLQVTSSDTLVRNVSHAPFGYPKVATFLDSDESFSVFRRFGYVQSRLLLEKQDDLSMLERQLDQMDFRDVRGEGNEHNLCSRLDIDEPEYGGRRGLMKALEATYCEYANLMRSAQILTSLNKPTSRDYKSVRNWMNNEKPLVDVELDFIRHKEDLVTFRPGRAKAWLDISIEKLLHIFHGTFVEHLFYSLETRTKTDGYSFFYSPDRVEWIANSIIILAIVGLLAVPMFLLRNLAAVEGDGYTEVGIILGFTLIYSAVLSISTRAKRHEILAAAAAYCAILVVLLGNVQPTPRT